MKQNILSVGFGLSATNVFSVYFETKNGVSLLAHLPHAIQRFGGDAVLSEPGPAAREEAKAVAKKLKVPYAGEYFPGTELGNTDCNEGA